MVEYLRLDPSVFVPLFIKSEKQIKTKQTYNHNQNDNTVTPRSPLQDIGPLGLLPKKGMISSKHFLYLLLADLGYFWIS